VSSKSTTVRYGTVAVTIHWISAVLIIGLLGSGFVAARTADVADKVAILRVHVPVAILVLVLTLGRLWWWWQFDSKPEPVAGVPRWQERSARAVHVLLYVAVIGALLSGIAMMAFSGALPIVFGGDSADFPDLWDYPPRFGHAITFWALVALLVLHVGAALQHHFVRRDDVLRRMWFAG
jgi:cytochrome b561